MSDESGYRAARTGLVRLGNTVVPAAVTTWHGGAGDAPHVTATYEIRNGRPECVHLEITARPDGRGIRLRDLELFTLDAATEAAFARSAIPAAVVEREDPRGLLADDTADHDERRAAARAVLGAAHDGVDEQTRRAMRSDVREARQSRRRPTKRDELEQVAQVYREHVDGHPTQAVKIRLGYESDRTAARRVQQARAAGLLPPTTPGKRKA